MPAKFKETTEKKDSSKFERYILVSILLKFMNFSSFENGHLCFRLKLIDSLSTFFDYDFQVLLIDVIFNLYGKIFINAKLKALFPESKMLCQTFAKINLISFEKDVRSFLNILNESSGKIHSIICKSMKLDNVTCKAPEVSP